MKNSNSFLKSSCIDQKTIYDMLMKTIFFRLISNVSMLIIENICHCLNENLLLGKDGALAPSHNVAKSRLSHKLQQTGHFPAGIDLLKYCSL